MQFCLPTGWHGNIKHVCSMVAGPLQSVSLLSLSFDGLHSRIWEIMPFPHVTLHGDGRDQDVH